MYLLHMCACLQHTRGAGDSLGKQVLDPCASSRSAGSKHFYPLNHPADKYTLLEAHRAEGGIQW